MHAHTYRSCTQTRHAMLPHPSFCTGARSHTPQMKAEEASIYLAGLAQLDLKRQRIMPPNISQIPNNMQLVVQEATELWLCQVSSREKQSALPEPYEFPMRDPSRPLQAAAHGAVGRLRTVAEAAVGVRFEGAEEQESAVVSTCLAGSQPRASLFLAFLRVLDCERSLRWRRRKARGRPKRTRHIIASLYSRLIYLSGDRTPQSPTLPVWHRPSRGRRPRTGPCRSELKTRGGL